MRRMLAALMLTFGVIGMADVALASVYVPGHIRDGIYIRPHFVAAPNVKYGIWPDESVGAQPSSDRQRAPLLDPAPSLDRDKLGEPS
jgi:hypothetical protein